MEPVAQDSGDPLNQGVAVRQKESGRPRGGPADGMAQRQLQEQKGDTREWR